jgi:uncharacterized protein (DUF849 family)
VPSEDDPKVAGPGTTLMAPERRVEHVEILRPDICTLDLNTMNSGGEVVINMPRNVRKMAARIRAAKVLPELELFDTGDCHLGISKGVLAKTNAELVTHAANILRSLGATIASTADARALLGLS